MKKTSFKLRQNFIIALLLGLCLTLISAVPAFAASNDAEKLSIQIESTSENSSLTQKQQEIDKYVFEEHTKDIEKQGFKVTHTGQANGYVEIGITPFTNKNAEYLYNIFGKDKVKVVKGGQAVLLNSGVNETSSEVSTKIISSNLLAYAAVLVVAMGAVILISKKRKTAK